MIELAAEERKAIADAWLRRAAAAYPPETARFLLAERDPFRNPVGGALRRVLPVLLDELAGGMDEAALAPALDEIMHIRAVQYFTAEEAVGFVFLLLDVLAERRPELAALLRGRIELLAEMARSEFAYCQDRIREIRGREQKRRTSALHRVKSEGDSCC